MPKRPPPDAVPANKAVLAAGAVLWRPSDDAAERRSRGRSTGPATTTGRCPRARSIPARPNRSPPCGRSHEETGLRVASRPAAGRGELSGRTQGIKKVRYWAARSVGGEFTPNAEVDELKWLPVAAAMKQLSYPHDRKVLRRFAKLPADTKTVLIVRHGTAGSKSRYKGDDRKRPLDKRGRAQAESLVGQLLAFGADALYAADRVRCHQTIEPLAEELGVRHSQRAAADRGGVRGRPQGRPAAAFWRSPPAEGTPVICTQGKVIPDLIAWWCERDGVRPDKSRNRKGSTWVMSSWQGRSGGGRPHRQPAGHQEIATCRTRRTIRRGSR